MHRTRLVFAGSVVVLAGCSLVYSTSGLSGGPLTADAAVDAPMSASDATNLDDAPTALFATACDAAASPSESCRAVGLCCPANASFCLLEVTDAGLHVACAAAPGPSAVGAPCTPAVGDCADGLACAFAWTDPPYACTPLCKQDTDCPTATPFCNQRVVQNSTALFQCGACDPTTAATNECNGHSCYLPSTNLAPVCDNGSSFNHALGPNDSCNIGDDCVPSGVCVCNDGGLVGDDCTQLPRGTCYRACRLDHVGELCSDIMTTCTVVPGTSDAYCR